MRKIWLTIVATLAIVAVCEAASLMPRFQAGFRLINGSDLNKLSAAIDQINDGVNCATYMVTGTPAATDQAFYLATKSMIVKRISEIHAVAAGGASVLQVTKDTGTTAPGAGTDLLTNNTNTGFDLNATANTTQVGTLVATTATLTLAAGDRLSVDYANTIQSTAGVVVTACLAPL